MTKAAISFLMLVLMSISHAEATPEDKNLLSGKIEFTENIRYSEAVEIAKKLSNMEGMQSLWVRKMGKEKYGVSLILNFDGSKAAKHELLQKFRKKLGKAIKSWDLATGVTWIKGKNAQ